MLMFVLTLFNALTLCGQRAYSAQDSIRIFGQLDLADEQDYRGALDSALATITRVMQDARKKNMARGLAFAQLKKADLLLKKSDYPEIEGLLAEGYLIGASLKDSLIMGLSHTQRSQYNRTLGNYEPAISSLLKALECFSPTHHELYIGIAYNDLAHIYSKISDFEQSIDYGYRALKVFERIGDRKETANTLNNIAINYFRLNQKSNAIDLFKKALGIQEEIGDQKRIVSTLGNLVVAYSGISLDSAIAYQEKALALVGKLGIKSAQAQSFSQTAVLYERKKEFQRSLDYFQRSLVLYEEIRDVSKMASQSIHCATQAMHLNDSLLAENYFDRAFRYTGETGDLGLWQNFHLARSGFYQHFNNFQRALWHYKESVVWKDSMLNERTGARIAELGIQYETQKKELMLANSLEEQKRKESELQLKNKELSIVRLLNLKNEQELLLSEKEQELQDLRISELSIENNRKELINQNQLQQVEWLEKENRIKQKLIDQKNMLIAISLLAVAGLIGLGFLVYNRFKLKNEINERIAQDKVRDRIARDLHDEIGSALTSIHLLSISTEHQLDQDGPDARESIREIRTQSKNIQGNMSDIVWALGSDHAGMESLCQRVREFAARNFELANVKLHFQQDPRLNEESLGLELRKELILISKEMIHNVIKHANAQNAHVEFSRSGNGIKLRVMDDGPGWTGQQSTGTGLKSMQERARRIGGAFRLYRENARTIAEVVVP